MAIKKDHKIEKSNKLNELRSTSMSLHEVRFLTIYMSKINARKPETRVVQFPLEDFRKIMDLGRLNITQLSSATDRLLQKIYTTRLQSGGYESFQLFKKCKVDKNENDEWFIEIDAHDEALPLFFEFKKEYFTYELWNALRLTSANQIRMYEILKQHQQQKKWYCSLQDLRTMLFIEDNEYPRFQNFKVRVLESCQQSLKEKTDIKFEYELEKKGPKIIGITFFIEKNEDYIDQLTLSEFIDSQYLDTEDTETPKNKFKSEKLEFLNSACNDEFTEQQIQVLFDLLVKVIPSGSSSRLDLDRYDYLAKKYHEMELRKPQKSRFGYLKAMIQADCEA